LEPPAFAGYSFSQFYYPPNSIILLVVVSILFVIISAIISGTELAYFSLSAEQLNKLQEEKTVRSKRILKALKHPKRLIATAFLASSFTNIVVVILTVKAVRNIFIANDFSEKYVLVSQISLVVFILVFVGDILPKVYAHKASYKLAKIMSGPVLFLTKLFYPFSSLLIKSTSIIDKKVKKRRDDISVNELGHAIELTNDGTTTKDEEKLLMGIIKFGNIDVTQIMTARTDCSAIDYNTPFKELIAEIVDLGYSRVPVYKENFDKIVGILYMKDLLPFLKNDDFFWQSLLREPYFVPVNKKLNDLLKEFQVKKMHLAVVVDEYGGTSGIVTLEDIMEEIVGEITDEFDDESLLYSKLDNDNYVFEGKISLIDVYRILEIEGDDFEESKGDSDTLAGFLLERWGKIPLKNDKIEFNNYLFTIEAADKRKIKRIKLTIKQVVSQNG
jgi:putative hemolysin